jgi:hypothetical protein
MATRPGNGQQTAPQQGTRLAAATLVIAISGLLSWASCSPVILARRRCRCPGGREPGAGPGAAQLGRPWSDHRRPGRRRDRPAHDRALLDGFDRLSRPQVLGRAWSSVGGPGGATPRRTGHLDRPGHGGAEWARCPEVKARGERSWPTGRFAAEGGPRANLFRRSALTGATAQGRPLDAGAAQTRCLVAAGVPASRWSRHGVSHEEASVLTTGVGAVARLQRPTHGNHPPWR